VTIYLDCWIATATALFAQALAGEPQLTESQVKSPANEAFGLAATVSGDIEGRFSVFLEAGILESPLMGEATDQRAGWGELLREVADAVSGELLAKSGIRCRVEKLEPIAPGIQIQATRCFLLKAGDRAWTIAVLDEIRSHSAKATPESPSAQSGKANPPRQSEPASSSAGVDLLLDVELEATLRFGCRELPLGEILELGPGDVVQLDRHIADPVDLVVGDKIVARGEVVLVNGNFGLRVTEVAAPRKRLESIRCLF
jgi:flagellar motor switch protein FliN